VQLNRGYSRDHRPDLNQIVLNLIVEDQSSMPLFLKVSNGNSSDKANFAEIVKEHTKSLQAALNNRYIVGDSAMYTPNSLTSIAQSGSYFVTRVPLTLHEAQDLIANTKMNELLRLNEDGYWGKDITTNYAEIKQRWIVIFSQEAFEQESKTLDRNILKLSEAESKQFSHLQNQIFACEADARKAFNKFITKSKVICIANYSISAIPHYNNRGKPTTNKQPDYYEYLISGNAYISLETRNKAQQEKGFFVIATNDLEQNKFTLLQVLETYKSQQSVERGFRFLKSPEFLTVSFYLKSPGRIEALLCIMTMCLLIYCALEYKIRQELLKQNKYFPDQKKKNSQKPTARWIFFCFQGISVVITQDTGTIGAITNIMDRQLIILRILGLDYQNIYS
jgi:transposase